MPHPLRVQILSIWHTKFSKRNCLGSQCPPMRSAPPTGYPGSATGAGSLTNLKVVDTFNLQIPIIHTLSKTNIKHFGSHDPDNETCTIVGTNTKLVATNSMSQWTAGDSFMNFSAYNTSKIERNVSFENNINSWWSGRSRISRRRGRLLLKRLCFVKFLCQNGRIATIGVGRTLTPPLNN